MKIFIANDKGGVGKSTIAQYCIVRSASLEMVPRIVDYDRQPKLGRFFGEKNVISNSIGPSFAQHMMQSDSFASFWDPIVRWVRVQRPLVVDFGAQAWEYFAEWAIASEFRDTCRDADIVLLVPLVADIEAVTGALRVLREAPEIFARARILVLACAKDGALSDLAKTPEFEELRREIDRTGAQWIEIPVLHRDGYPILAARGLRFDQIVSKSANELTAITGAPRTRMARARLNVHQWIMGMDQSLGRFLWNLDHDQTNDQAPARPAMQSPEQAQAESQARASVEPRAPVTETPLSRAPASKTPAEADATHGTSTPAQTARPTEGIFGALSQKPERMAPSPTFTPAQIPAAARIPPMEPAMEAPRSAPPAQAAAAQAAAAQTVTGRATPTPPPLPDGEFDEIFYLARYPDIAREVAAGFFGSGLEHYSLHGRREGRLARWK